jgi:hypothetical protein
MLLPALQRALDDPREAAGPVVTVARQEPLFAAKIRAARSATGAPSAITIQFWNSSTVKRFLHF